MSPMDFCKRINIICGHYGSGKTNFAVNLAVELRRQGKAVTLVDLDIVNPYFRSADFSEALHTCGIKTISPEFANSNLDIPGITAEVYSVFEESAGTIVIDVGGDDAGAAALGRYAAMVPKDDYTMLCVLNSRRYLTRSAGEATSVTAEIARASRISPTGLVNNTNLGEETTALDILASLPYAAEAAEKTGLPVVATAYEKRFEAELAELGGISRGFPVELYVRKPWEPRAQIRV